MTPEQIKSAIGGARTSQRAIADFLGVSPGFVGRVIAGHARSQRVEHELEKIVGHKIFPPRRKPGPKPTTWTGRVEQEAA